MAFWLSFHRTRLLAFLYSGAVELCKSIGQALGLELPHNTPASSRHRVATLHYEYAISKCLH